MRRPAASPDLRLRLGAVETRVPAWEAVAPGARRDRGPETPPGEENQTLATPSDSGWPAPPRGNAARRRGLGDGGGERFSVPGGLGTQPREAEAPPPAPVPPPGLRSPGPGPCSTSSRRAPPPRQRPPPRTAIGCCKRRRSLPAEGWGQEMGSPCHPASAGGPSHLGPPCAPLTTLRPSRRLKCKSPQRTGVLCPQSRPVPHPDSSSSWGSYDPRRSTLPYTPLSTTTP